ncbi:MAG: hypothetical protein D3915_02370 [Candidatus Electrothrix sp. AU1_5]|nr:hypothetical protein [Candidatus Electrothrix gigas]
MITAGQRVRAENIQQNHSVSVLAQSVGQQVMMFEKLIGQWKRADGDYTIEFINNNSDGIPKAIYYNPKPIHIAQTKISSENGAIKVFIKLQDKGYPGSTYTLHYVPSDDILQGNYFHAGLQQQFPVVFNREQQEKP